MNDRLIILVLTIGVIVLSAALVTRSSSNESEDTITLENSPTIKHQAPQTTSSISRAPKAASLGRESDGHFWTRADVDGTSIKFLVDTGASVVALTYRDAQRLRLKPEELDFIWTIRTANGETQAASVLLPFIRIGNVRVENVEAMILKNGLLDNSLLGMSFLGELYSYEFKGNTMIIRQ